MQTFAYPLIVMYDLLIIGGGINGTAIACDAAGRDLSVLLCEKDDLASHTSSASTKLIHGGLRYLEQYEFKLVREALLEREILLKKAPHIIWPLEFVMPNVSAIRSYWMIRLGLILYDHLAGRKHLKASYGINLAKHLAGSVLNDEYNKGFIYSDCWVDDARLVVLNARAAQEHGATILTRTECISATRHQDSWTVTLRDNINNEEKSVEARVLVNAAGPWVDQVRIDKTHTVTQKNITLIKGSHIIVPKIHADNYAYILQHTDNRVLFVIPYLDKYSLIGTTEIPFDDDPQDVTITKDEITYLCDAVNQFFKQTITPEDIIWSYSGVRPLKCDDPLGNPSQISRDYELILDDSDKKAPILNVYGGKITTHRTLSEHAMAILRPFLPDMGPNWTAKKPLQ